MSGRPDATKAGSTRVSFVCQQCHYPLQLDRSFGNISQRTYIEVTEPLTSSVAVEDDAVEVLTEVQQSTEQCEMIIKKSIPPSARSTSFESGGFTLVGEAKAGESHAHKITAFLFDFLSGQSEIDHPLCEECTDTLLDLLDTQLKMTEDECKEYRNYLEKLGTEEEKTDEKALDEELEKLELEETSLKKQLKDLEKEHSVVSSQISEEQKKEELLMKEEESYCKKYNEFKRQLFEYEDAQRSVDNQLKYAQEQLDKLTKTNVFNATFFIWHSGHFGTINGFKLGRLPSVPVDWNEINAAWGQTVLLLQSLANKMGLKFKRYRLVPYGNHSFLESLEDKSKELPLYASGGLRFFWDTKFDQAMVAFLDCLQQFKEEVEKSDTGFRLPYKMDKGKIEDTTTSYSIKIQFNSEEQWTKALKFMLTNLKWGLAWVNAQFSPSNRTGFICER